MTTSPASAAGAGSGGRTIELSFGTFRLAPLDEHFAALLVRLHRGTNIAGDVRQCLNMWAQLLPEATEEQIGLLLFRGDDTRLLMATALEDVLSRATSPFFVRGKGSKQQIA